MKNLKFGVDFDYYVEYGKLRELARHYESLGVDSLWVMDHLIWERSGNAVLECLSTLAALAEATEKIRLGSMVVCNGFRNPALLAKITATIDLISNGRFTLGIGAGWKENEHKAYGYEFPPPRERVERLEEAIQIVKAMWTQRNPVFHGRYYSIEGAICEPKPIQKPHPPILIGGRGRRILEITARYGDAYNMVFHTPEEARRRLSLLEKLCLDVGRDYRSLEKTWLGPVLIAETYRELKQGFKAIGGWNSIEEFKARGIVGTPEECADKIELYADMGITHFILTTRGLHRQIDLLLEKVVSIL